MECSAAYSRNVSCSIRPSSLTIRWRTIVWPVCAFVKTSAMAKGPRLKYFDHEIIGVCVRVELGPKDVAKEQCVMVRRDNRQKDLVPLAQAVDRAKVMLDAMQADLQEAPRR
jgi:prolyl-tRNA synthetase